MELNKLSKPELIIKCTELGINKCKSKNKNQLIELINKMSNVTINVKETITTAVTNINGNTSINDGNTSINNDNHNNDNDNDNDNDNNSYDSNTSIDIKNIDGLSYLKTIENNSVDLILTDPPYIISKETGMDIHYNTVKYNEENDITQVKTNEEWETYKLTHHISDDKNKENYIKYGTIYGKKYCVKTDYGDWDSEFTIDILDEFICQYYKKLRKGGTLIIFFDLWKITNLKNILEKYNFKQIRFIEWIKTNPQPINSKVNYLTNCREIALIGVKGGSPTFNSSYDKGIYEFPLQGGKNRFHPTQKSLHLFEELIKKHSNENDTVLDTFLGGGTTAIACKNSKRKFKGCEISKEYYDKILEIL
jgi:site-specific DNA-methyltransferase (adenine-specific)